MNHKLTHPSITLPPEVIHQLQNLLCTGSALAAHAQRYSKSHIICHEISHLWQKQLAQVRPWLTSSKD